jgi:hypothetical protein
MNDYHVYVIDGHDHIIEHIELDCADDNAAIEYASITSTVTISNCGSWIAG